MPRNNRKKKKKANADSVQNVALSQDDVEEDQCTSTACDENAPEITEPVANTYTGSLLHPDVQVPMPQMTQLQMPQTQLQPQQEQEQLEHTLQTAPSANNAQAHGGAQQMVQPTSAPQALPTNYSPWPLDDVLAEKYECNDLVGTGVYGTVYKATHRDTRRVVAIKKLKTDEDYQCYQQGVPAQVLREVACLRDLVHPNVVELLDVHIGGVNDYSLIFEFVEGDLHKMLKTFRNDGRKLGIDLVRKYAYELLNGIHACHVRLILHRDLKPQNILIGPSGLKIGDFGLSRIFSLPLRNYSLDVITLWYRAPEILLGCHQYGAEVDMWSAGCIIAEMATGAAIFNGDSEIGTLFKIFKYCGTPSEATWNGLDKLEHWKTSFPNWPPTNLRKLSNARPELGEDDMELVRNLLVLVPRNRINARKAKNMANQCVQSGRGSTGP